MAVLAGGFFVCHARSTGDGANNTIDAMGCQKQSAEIICEKGADYIFRLKANEPRAAMDNSTLDLILAPKVNAVDVRLFR